MDAGSDPKNQLKAYLLCRTADADRLYQSWVQRLSLPCEVVEDYLPEWQPPSDAGILITHRHYCWEDLATLRRLYQQNHIPILILCDGVLEYRNTWLNPQIPEGCLFQPVIGHKLACIGRAPARILESWGNLGKCEIVGLPHLDKLSETPPSPINTEGKFRLLIATARTPAFNPSQREVVLNSLIALKQYLLKQTFVAGRPIEVHWRLSGGLNKDLAIDTTEQPDPAVVSMAEQIDQSDAVIITASTGYLECLLRKRPTAVLDFHNVPSYLNPAWTISAESQIASVISELAFPPAPKMLHQSQTLYDQLECGTPATDRMIVLVEKMVAEYAASIQQGRPLNLSKRILIDERAGFSPVTNEFDLSRLFPNNSAYQNTELQHLQVELAAAISRLDTLPVRLNELQNQLKLNVQALDNAKDRNRELHLRLIRIKKRFGIDPKFDIE